MCHVCGEPLDRDRKPGFNETCAACGRDVHVCLACVFHSPGAHWDCRETVDSHVLDKDRRNHCDWFATNPRYHSRTAGMTGLRDKAVEARKGFDSLFG